jgi:hypothetical protein
MKEIAENIYIEQNSLGLYGGILRPQDNLILIDSPFNKGEFGNWKASLVDDTNEQACYLVVLDNNYDRLLSMKGCDCSVVSHFDGIAPIRNKSLLKNLDEPQSYSESSETIQLSNRLINPDINFENELSLYFNDMRIALKNYQGSNVSAIWARIPERNVIFVGDAVVVDQPPFLAYANLPLWEEELKLLSSNEFADYQIVSSRSGVVGHDQVVYMMESIAFVRGLFDELKAKDAPLTDWLSKIPQITAKISQLDLFNSEVFYNRLYWGISTYYDLNCRERG